MMRRLSMERRGTGISWVSGPVDFFHMNPDTFKTCWERKRRLHARVLVGLFCSYTTIYKSSRKGLHSHAISRVLLQVLEFMKALLPGKYTEMGLGGRSVICADLETSDCRQPH